MRGKSSVCICWRSLAFRSNKTIGIPRSPLKSNERVKEGNKHTCIGSRIRIYIIYISTKKFLIHFSKRFRCQHLYLLANSHLHSTLPISFHTDISAKTYITFGNLILLSRFVAARVFQVSKQHTLSNLGRRRGTHCDFFIWMINWPIPPLFARVQGHRSLQSFRQFLDSIFSRENSNRLARSLDKIRRGKRGEKIRKSFENLSWKC